MSSAEKSRLFVDEEVFRAAVEVEEGERLGALGRQLAREFVDVVLKTHGSLPASP
jgi:hypothetical protein